MSNELHTALTCQPAKPVALPVLLAHRVVDNVLSFVQRSRLRLTHSSLSPSAASKCEARATSGFTIFEFLIATTIFAVVLLIFSAAFTRIGKLFYKGVISSKTQEEARSLIDEVSRNVQFSSGFIKPSHNPPTPAPLSGTVCIGNTQYTFNKNVKVTTGTSALLRSASTTGCAPPPMADANEIIPQNMRITEFSVTPQGSSLELYNIAITVAFGDDDLLEDIAGSKQCKGTAGSQFCAVSSLKTTVARRIQ